MTRRIINRIWSLAIIATLAIVGLCVATLWQIESRAEAARWVEHTEQVIGEANAVFAQLIDAETSQRGYLLTHDDVHVVRYHDIARGRPTLLKTLKELTVDNAVQQAQLDQMQVLIATKFRLMDEILDHARAGRDDQALAMVREGSSSRAMDLVRQSFASFLAVERSLLEKRRADASQSLSQLLAAIVLGGLLAAALVVAASWRLVRRLGEAFRELFGGIDLVSSGELEHRIPVTGDDEIAQIAFAFNTMATNLAVVERVRDHAEVELQQTNEELLGRTADLERRSTAIDLLGRMAHRLQAARTEAEFGEIVRCFVPQILPLIPGALYLLNNSRNLLERSADWLDPLCAPEAFTPEDCWGLRRGQVHQVRDTDHDVCCHHVDERALGGYACLPLLAQGDIIGLLYLESGYIPGLGTAGGYDYTAVLGENVALALVNHRLRESLKEQSIRDALTGLFNRRYLEEAAQLEFARAVRSQTPVGVLMVDVDHFKKFNDKHGHDAGDHLLRLVAQALQAQVRGGDVVCRYGGEEFTVLLPGANVEQAAERAEMLRQAVKALQVSHRGEPVGSVTISLGLALFPDHGDTPATVMAAADAALYQAKHSGRDRVQAAPQTVLA